MAKYAARLQRVTGSTILSVGGVNATTITQLRRGKIGDVILGTHSAPDDKAIHWVLRRFTSPGTASPVQPGALDPADPPFCGQAGESHSVEPSYTPDELLNVAFNQRATFRWMAAPGGELIYPATAGYGIGVSTPAITPVGTPSFMVSLFIEE